MRRELDGFSSLFFLCQRDEGKVGVGTHALSLRVQVQIRALPPPRRAALVSCSPLPPFPRLWNGDCHHFTLTLLIVTIFGR